MTLTAYEPKPPGPRAARLFDGSDLDLRLGSDGFLRLYRPQLLVALKPGDLLYMGPGFQRGTATDGFDTRYARIDEVEHHPRGWKLTVTWLWPEEAFDGHRPEGPELPRGGPAPVGGGVLAGETNSDGSPSLQTPELPVDGGPAVQGGRGGSEVPGATRREESPAAGGGVGDQMNLFDGPIPEDAA